MLIDCPECNAQVSDQATSCPQCGHPLQADAPPVEPPAHSEGSPSLFALLAVAAAATGLFTPRLIVVLPSLAAIVFGIISLSRKERYAWAGVVSICLAILYLVS